MNTSLLPASQMSSDVPLPTYAPLVAQEYDMVLALRGAADSARASLGAAFGLLSRPREDSPEITARRASCAILAGFLSLPAYHCQDFAGADLREAYPWFQAQIDAWMDAHDWRLRSMACTAQRELEELSGERLLCPTGLSILYSQNCDLTDLILRGLTTPGAVRKLLADGCPGISEEQIASVLAR